MAAAQICQLAMHAELHAFAAQGARRLSAKIASKQCLTDMTGLQLGSQHTGVERLLMLRACA